jgi:hypothetical protein
LISAVKVVDFEATIVVGGAGLMVVDGPRNGMPGCSSWKNGRVGVKLSRPAGCHNRPMRRDSTFIASLAQREILITFFRFFNEDPIFASRGRR